MAKMRTTTHSGRFKGASGKHNDREFDLEKAPHIDQSRLELNQYWTCYGNDVSFHEAEKRFYKETFGEMMKDINERAEKSRHLERRTNVSKMLSSKKTMPEEVIFQIGEKGNCASKNDLVAVFNDYIKWHEEKFAKHVKTLNVSLHQDETSVHIHVRRVWVYDDLKGFKAVGQHKALEQMGYELPDKDKPRGRQNNLKTVYTAECREKWLDLCHEHGLEVEREPEKRPVTEQNLQKNDAIMRKQELVIAEQETALAEVQQSLDEAESNLHYALNSYNAVKEEYEGYLEDKEDLRAVVYKLQNANKELEMNNKRLVMANSALKEENTALQDEISGLRSLVERLSKECEVVKKKLEEFTNMLKETPTELAERMANYMKTLQFKDGRTAYDVFMATQTTLAERFAEARRESDSMKQSMSEWKRQLDRGQSGSVGLNKTDLSLSKERTDRFDSGIGER